eukprot:CAMPEP_0179044516 /NCGR_PEP_ID=MMETSP0796-20121207/17711_1 /TAXON_ID=73915 /ORGANISM="Pyrodinium bahamense, Strain pbaha01" /LENGTH=431 /DNA_ID=CAMNT_0020740911 /DNA_START=277 /DNA_END=1572 /DNA_ORIENTATION=-
MPLSATIDDKNNVYIAADQGLYKLNSDGKLIWKFEPGPAPGHSKHGNLVPDGASLYNGAAYVDTTDGRVFAIDMETGSVIWDKQVAPNICYDTGFVAVWDGIAILETDGIGGAQCKYVRGLNATDGSELWRFEPDDPVWDLMAQYLEDDSFVFQDFTGKVYRNVLSNGTNIWKNGGRPSSWTDGTQGLGPNGIVYAVNTHGCMGKDCHGHLTAYRVSDGKMLWQREVPRPPNSSPVVGRLTSSERLSVVIPIGQQPSCSSLGGILHYFFPRVMGLLPQSVSAPVFYVMHKFFYHVVGDLQSMIVGELPTDIYAFDAETGALQWNWTGPTWKRFQCPGDDKYFIERYQINVRAASCPTPWGAPRVGADGTLYAGNQNGVFYAIRDWNEDGKIDDATEVSSFDCGAEFSSAGSAHGDGMVVMASGVRVWAWKV